MTSRMQIGTHLFAKNSKNDVPYHHPKSVGPKPLRVPFGTLKVLIGTPKVPNGTLG